MSLRAAAALTAVLLARGGVRGFDRPLDGKNGLFALQGADPPDDSMLLDALGERYEGAYVAPSSRGRVAAPPMPTCRWHWGLPTANGVDSREIAGLRLRGGSMTSIVVDPRAAEAPAGDRDRHEGNSASISRLRSPCPGSGGLTLESILTPARLEDLRVLRLADRVRFDFDESLAGLDAVLELETVEAVLTAAVDAVYGSPANPMSRDDLVGNFRDCLRHAPRPISEMQGDLLAEAILQLDELDDVGAVLAGTGIAH